MSQGSCSNIGFLLQAARLNVVLAKATRAKQILQQVSTHNSGDSTSTAAGWVLWAPAGVPLQ
jgi:hypothetical protein